MGGTSSLSNLSSGSGTKAAGLRFPEPRELRRLIWMLGPSSSANVSSSLLIWSSVGSFDDGVIGDILGAVEIEREAESGGTGGTPKSQYSGLPVEESKMILELECRPADIVVLLQCFFISSMSTFVDRARGIGSAAL